MDQHLSAFWFEKFKFFNRFEAMCKELAWHPITNENITDALAMVEKAEEELREVRQNRKKATSRDPLSAVRV